MRVRLVFLGSVAEGTQEGDNVCIFLLFLVQEGFLSVWGLFFYLFSSKKEQVTKCPFISTSALKYRHLLPISFEFVRKTLLLLVWLCLQTEAH